jgi:hypothetical protein
MSEPKPTDPVTHMQLREYLLKYVPVEELANYPTLVSLADAMEGVATVEELQAQGREMMASFVAKYEAREERFKDFTLVAWAAAIRHEMHEADNGLRRETVRLRAETKATIDKFSADIASQFRAYEERMRDYMRALFEPLKDTAERVTKLEELVPRVERLESKVFAPKRASQAPKRRRTPAKRR